MDVSATTTATVAARPGKSAQSVGHMAKAAVAEARANGIDLPKNAQGMAASAIAKGADPASVFAALVVPPVTEPPASDTPATDVPVVDPVADDPLADAPAPAAAGDDGAEAAALQLAEDGYRDAAGALMAELALPFSPEQTALMMLA